jgi:bifunctional enzyme CysN/CysC
VWERGQATREDRWAALGQSGATVWLTGLPSSGKSAIAAALEAKLVGGEHGAYFIDGDNLRHGLSGDLGFDAGSRAENSRRAGEAARMMADAGLLVLVALVSPYAEHRKRVRERHAEDGLAFVEVFVDTPLEVCEARDPKGLYRRARAGTLRGLTGIDDPYEPPPEPDLVLDGTAPLERSVTALEALLLERELI